MALTDKELKKMVKGYMEKNSPELADEEPVISVESYEIPEGVARKLGVSMPKSAKTVEVLTYKKMVTAEDGAKLPIVTRVTVDQDGNIIKTTGN